MGAAAESAAVAEAAEATIICIRCKRCMPREQIDQKTYNCVDTVACHASVESGGRGARSKRARVL